MKLLHKLLPEKVNKETLKSISKNGLIPQLPSEYRWSLPTNLQFIPIVWLSESMNTIDGVIYSINSDNLEHTIPLSIE